MPAPVPIFTNLDWRENPGAELASVPGESPDEVSSSIGLAFDERTAKWVSPRAHLLTTGAISVADLDDEELLRGQVRDADGKFRSGPLRQIPKEFHDELMRRILEKGTDKLRKQYLNAIDVMVDIMNDNTQDAALRVRTAQYIIERLAGKTPDKVEAVVAVKPWEIALKGIIREVPAEVLDAEVVDDAE